MDNFGTWWESLGGIYRFFWTTSILATIIFIVMVILSVMGGDSDADADADGDAGGDTDADAGGGMMSYILSFKTLLAFLLGASWTGLSALYQGWSVFAIALTSIVSGVLMMALMAFLLSMFVKLQHDSTLEMTSTVGAQGVAYVTIPASGAQGGQVEILVNNSYKTFEAITDEALPIATEEPIEVIDILDNNVLLVRRRGILDEQPQQMNLPE